MKKSNFYKIIGNIFIAIGFMTMGMMLLESVRVFMDRGSFIYLHYRADFFIVSFMYLTYLPIGYYLSKRKLKEENMVLLAIIFFIIAFLIIFFAKTISIDVISCGLKKCDGMGEGLYFAFVIAPAFISSMIIGIAFLIYREIKNRKLKR